MALLATSEFFRSPGIFRVLRKCRNHLHHNAFPRLAKLWSILRHMSSVCCQIWTQRKKFSQAIIQARILNWFRKHSAIFLAERNWPGWITLEWVQHSYHRELAKIPLKLALWSSSWNRPFNFIRSHFENFVNLFVAQMYTNKYWKAMGADDLCCGQNFKVNLFYSPDTSLWKGWRWAFFSWLKPVTPLTRHL
jgi:hypothetical protein